MRSYKSTYVLLIVFFVQISCGSRLKYFFKPNHGTSIQKNENFKSELIYYNKPRMNDEEFQYRLIIKFKNKEKIPLHSYFNVLDTSKLSVSCRYFSPWTVFNGVLLDVSGKVKILKMDKKRIVFKQKIIVNDKQYKRKYYFSGMRSIKITNQ